MARNNFGNADIFIRLIIKLILNSVLDTTVPGQDSGVAFSENDKPLEP
jgi:hypothetical protein